MIEKILNLIFLMCLIKGGGLDSDFDCGFEMGAFDAE